jgi:hypothetical protein
LNYWGQMNKSNVISWKSPELMNNSILTLIILVSVVLLITTESLLFQFLRKRNF